MIISPLLSIAQQLYTQEWLPGGKRRGRGKSAVEQGISGALIGGKIAGPPGAAIGAGIGAASGLLFGGESPEDKERRLYATEALKRQRKMQQYLQQQATAPLTAEDVARHAEMMKVLGPEIGAGLGRRGLVTSPLGASLAAKTSANALAQLAAQRQARAQSLLAGMPGGEGYFAAQDARDLMFKQQLGEIIGMISSDPDLRSFLGLDQASPTTTVFGGTATPETGAVEGVANS